MEVLTHSMEVLTHSKLMLDYISLKKKVDESTCFFIHVNITFNYHNVFRFKISYLWSKIKYSIDLNEIYFSDYSLIILQKLLIRNIYT